MRPCSICLCQSRCRSMPHQAGHEVVPGGGDTQRVARHRHFVDAADSDDSTVAHDDRLVREYTLFTHGHDVDVDESDGVTRLVGLSRRRCRGPQRREGNRRQAESVHGPDHHDASCTVGVALYRSAAPAYHRRPVSRARPTTVGTPTTNRPEDRLRDASPLREVWSVAWPTVLTMTSYTVMQFIDRLMVGQVGPLELAAQGNGSIWSFAPTAFAMGMLTVVNTFVAQHLGAERTEEAPKYGWAAVWLSVLVWLLVLVPWALLLPVVFGSMGHDESLRRMESGYAQIMIAGAVALLIGRGLHHYFFGLHRPKVVAAAALIGNVANVLLNYALIFGRDGLPAAGLPGVPGIPPMGIYGAAIATVCGSVIEMAIPAAIFLGSRMNRELRSRSAWRPQWSTMRDLIRIGWPAGIQLGNELLCWAIFMSALVGYFGPDHMTAGWIALAYMHLSFMPAVGFSVATTSLVGRYIGAGQPDVAVARARLALGLAVGYMTTCALLFFTFRYALADIFIPSDLDPVQAEHVRRVAANLLICAAVFQTVDAFGIVYTGALRGAGDTVWPGVVTVIYSWSLIVGGGWL
ncbi:MAG: MATE family efflux transporter, partial [Planctomycetota bacterium]